MNKICDLHTHSYFSDGTASPAQIIDQAAEMGLSAIALTDHNTVAGLPEFLTAAKNRDLLAVPGVEISTGYRGKELHILGLFLDPRIWDQVTDYLQIINQRKEESNRELIKRLKEAGYTLDYDALREQRQGNLNRAVIAAALLEQGLIETIKDAFHGILSSTHGFYTPPERISSLDAIDFLRTIHAVPVLAHPFLSMSAEEVPAFLQEAKPLGLAGMETHYATYSEETIAASVRMAETFGLLQSGGSDYHGTNKPDIQLGTGRGALATPDCFVRHLQTYQAQRDPALSASK